MEGFGKGRDFQSIAYGVNLDDKSDFRPGQTAVTQHGIVAPLLEAGLTKPEIRELAQEAGLRIWDKPAFRLSLFADRIWPPGHDTALSAVEQGEDGFAGARFQPVRVRHHGEIVRIEIDREEMARAHTPEMAADSPAYSTVWALSL